MLFYAEREIKYHECNTCGEYMHACCGNEIDISSENRTYYCSTCDINTEPQHQSACEDDSIPVEGEESSEDETNEGDPSDNGSSESEDKYGDIEEDIEYEDTDK